MKILFISYNKTFSYTEPEKWIERIKAYIGVPEALSKYYTVINIEQINYEGELNKNGIQHYFKKFNDNKKPFQLHNFIKSLDADVIIVHGMLFPKQVIDLRRIVGNHTKIIVQNHAEKPFGWPKKYWQKIADKSIDAYMFTSVKMADEWIQKKIIAGTQKVWAIMEASSHFFPLDKQISKRKTGITGSPVFLFVGRLDENKNPLKVVQSFLKYNKQVPGSKLYMLYHTTELLDAIKDVLNREDKEQSVVLIGKKEHSEMAYWFSASDFIIAASHYEGSGVAVCEAMSCGCIPILSSITAFNKLTANETCGILYDLNDENGLPEALLKTKQINVEEEKKKVLHQFYNDLSFEAIAQQINEKIKLLCP